MSPLPRSITQVPSTVHRSDLFFTETSPQSTSRPYPYPRHSFSTPSPSESSSQSSLHRSRTAPPPIPPKPSLSSPPPLPSVPEPLRGTVPLPPPLPPPHAAAPEEQSDLEAALELSRSETSNRAAFLEKLNSQEEEELARALEESLRTPSNPVPQAGPLLPSSSPPRSTRILHGLPEPPTTQPTPSSSPPQLSRAIGDRDSLASLPDRSSNTELSATTSPSLLDDEAFARQLAAQEEEEESSSKGAINDSTDSIEDDEAFARRLAAEEDEELKEESRVATVTQVPPNLPPTYDEAVPRPPRTSSLPVEPALPRTNSAQSFSPTGTPSDSPALRPLNPLRSAASESSMSLNPIRSPGLDFLAPLVPVRSPGSEKSLSEKSRLSTISSSSSSLSLLSKPDTPPASESTPINANHFVDIELLRGVSMSFAQPVISYQNHPMQGPAPNIISLSYGRSPPLHVQGPSWRHLLKLMARLSGTRVEPTVESMAQHKIDMRLRTVVQLIRPHISHPEWRTILWFTIDHPVPNQPQFRRYANNDVEVLPFSYSLAPVPTVLRDGADTPLSKTYTIPSTESLPYPILPITFPNLALYLQAALDESRRYMSDSSSGFRRLAKMIDMCYENDGYAETESRGVGKMFKKVMGRGNKNKKNGRGGNEDTYELVTPFVPDEWG